MLLHVVEFWYCVFQLLFSSMFSVCSLKDLFRTQLQEFARKILCFFWLSFCFIATSTELAAKYRSLISLVQCVKFGLFLCCLLLLFFKHS